MPWGAGRATSKRADELAVTELEGALQVVPISGPNVAVIGLGAFDGMSPLEVHCLRAPKLQDSRVVGNDVEDEPLLIAIESQGRLVSDDLAGG